MITFHEENVFLIFSSTIIVVKSACFSFGIKKKLKSHLCIKDVDKEYTNLKVFTIHTRCLGLSNSLKSPNLSDN